MVIPSFVAAAVAIPEASEVVFASRPIAITVKTTLTSDCPKLTIVADKALRSQSYFAKAVKSTRPSSSCHLDLTSRQAACKVGFVFVNH
mgnify:CR=1 FL=1